MIAARLRKAPPALAFCTSRDANVMPGPSPVIETALGEGPDPSMTDLIGLLILADRVRGALDASPRSGPPMSTLGILDRPSSSQAS